jgi:hypothetical protein
VTKSKMLRLAGHVARKREIKIEQEFIQKTWKEETTGDTYEYMWG